MCDNLKSYKYNIFRKISKRTQGIHSSIRTQNTKTEEICLSANFFLSGE